MIIIPNVKSLNMNEAEFVLSSRTKIILSDKCNNQELNYALILKEDIKTNTNLDLTISKYFEPKMDSIFLTIDQSIYDSYQIEINNDKITVTGKDSNGLLYGVQTLRQIIKQFKLIIKGCSIKDTPSLQNRGFYHDVTRGRVPTLESLKKLVDKLSYYKINQLQLYVEHTYYFEGFSEVVREGDPLTSEEILLLDDYCKARGIELVPSITTFGHFYRVLSSKTFEHLCELDNSFNQPFSFIDRMSHHTLNIQDEESFCFVKKMLKEYIPLFSSNKFNICCDETFDMGKGKSKELKDKIGEGQMYVNFVNKIVSYVKSFNKEVMMWGDIISNHSDLIQQLDHDLTCLTWWYSPEIKEDTIKLIHDNKLKQYVCSGTSSWNNFINPYYDAYLNIKGMALGGFKYHVEGLLNTNWGDFGNINIIDTMIPCLIYGAEFAWNCNDISYEEINEKISYLEYSDDSKQLMKILDQLSKTQIVNWMVAVGYLESKKGDKSWVNAQVDNFFNSIKQEDLIIAYQGCEMIINKLYHHSNNIKNTSLNNILIMARAISLFNKVGLVIKNEFYSDNKINLEFTNYALAALLEDWYMDYKKLWRSDSKESELFRIGEVIFAYADILRTI